MEAFNNNDPWDGLLSDSDAYMLSAAFWDLVLAIVIELATILTGPFVLDPADSSTLMALMFWLSIIAMVALATTLMAFMFWLSIIAMVALTTTLSFESAMKQREAAGELELEKQRENARDLDSEKTLLL